MSKLNLKNGWTVIALLLAMSGCAQLGTTHTATHEWSTENTLMVVIKDPRSERSRRNLAGPGYSPQLAYHSDPALARRVRSIATEHNLTVLTQWPVRNLEVLCFLIEKPSEAVRKRLEQDPRVEWVQPFNEFSLSSTSARSPAEFPVPPGLHSGIGLPSATAAGIRLAVVDTAVDETHPDLTRSVLRQQDFVGSLDTDVAEAHGTAVVGLIAAQPHSVRGLQGLASDAEVSVFRACWQVGKAPGKCNTLTLALALDAAIELQPHVLNLSLSGSKDRVLQALVEKLVDQGVLIIAAYDEKRSPEQRFPAATSGVIYAFGRDEQASRATDLNARTNSQTTLATTPSPIVSAPRQALTLTPSGGYDLVSGHSIAAPQISAVAARLIHLNPQLSSAEIAGLLMNWMDSTSALKN